MKIYVFGYDTYLMRTQKVRLICGYTSTRLHITLQKGVVVVLTALDTLNLTRLRQYKCLYKLIYICIQ